MLREDVRIGETYLCCGKWLVEVVSKAPATGLDGDMYLVRNCANNEEFYTNDKALSYPAGRTIQLKLF